MTKAEKQPCQGDRTSLHKFLKEGNIGIVVTPGGHLVSSKLLKGQQVLPLLGVFSGLPGKLKGSIAHGPSEQSASHQV